MMSERVTLAAVRYVAAMEAERGLRRARGASVCEHVAPNEVLGSPPVPAAHPDGGEWEQIQCWQMVDGEALSGLPTRERYGEGSPRGWCDSCTERQRLHVRLAAATKTRVGALASLRAAVRALPVGGAA